MADYWIVGARLLRAADCVRTGAAISECVRPRPQQRTDDRPLPLCERPKPIHIAAPEDGGTPFPNENASFMAPIIGRG